MKRGLIYLAVFIAGVAITIFLAKSIRIDSNTKINTNIGQGTANNMQSNSRKKTVRDTNNDISARQHNSLLSRTAPINVKIPVLLYHHLSPSLKAFAPTSCITPSRFEEQISTLKKNGYNAIDFKQLYDFCTRGKKLPVKPFIITFDDGYLSNYELAFPILKKYNTKATIFIVTAWTTRSPQTIPHFSWDQAKEMEKSGLIDIDNHTCSHIECSKLSDKRLTGEVTKAEEEIEANLGKRKILSFSYPAYSDTPETVKVLDKLGYKIQLTGLNGIVSKNSSLVNIKRLLMSNDYSGNGLLSIIEWWQKRATKAIDR